MVGGRILTGVRVSCLHRIEADGLGFREGVAETDLFGSIGHVDLTGDRHDAGTERDVGVEAGHC
jgi:predicted alpha/beta-hydrolase family hydrolase